MWEIAVLANLKILSQHARGRIEENRERSRPVSMVIFGPVIWNELKAPTILHTKQKFYPLKCDVRVR
jgi:hypothetical protein